MAKKTKRAQMPKVLKVNGAREQLKGAFKWNWPSNKHSVHRPKGSQAGKPFN